MRTGDGDGEDEPTTTFADILNRLTLTGGHAEPSPAPPEPPRPARHSQRPDGWHGPVVDHDELDAPAALVRPYALTGGRTSSSVPLQLETLVSASRYAPRPLTPEHRAVVDLCRQSRSVVEIAAMLSIPLGVTKVLLGDMAELGLVLIHPSRAAAPTLGLMQQVLDGLRAL